MGGLGARKRVVGNISMEIGILEARIGLEPSIKKCKAIAYQQNKSSMDTVETLAQNLKEARGSKLDQKLYFYQQQLKRVLKKAKTFSTQRIIKKIKDTKDEETGAIAKLESKMAAIKALDPEICADYLWKKRIIKRLSKENRLHLNCKQIEDDIEQIKITGIDIDLALIECNCLNTGIQEIYLEMNSFISELFHHKPLVTQQEERDQRNNKKKRSSAEKKTNHLKADKNTIKQSAKIITTAKSKQEEKKNRKGQRARRLEWESKYGKDAKHLASFSDSTSRPSLSRNDSQPKESQETKLHPSWEAKKKQKIAISDAPINNRIVFSDNE